MLNSDGLSMSFCWLIEYLLSRSVGIGPELLRWLEAGMLSLRE